MPKPPRVIGVVTEPAPPSWWRAHRHQVLLMVGLFAGFYLCSHTTGEASHPTGPPPATAPTTPRPAPPVDR